MSTPSRSAILSLLLGAALSSTASADPDPGACAALSNANTDLIQLSVIIGQVDSIVTLAERAPGSRVADPTQFTHYLTQARDLEYQTADDVEDALPAISDPKSAQAAQEAINAFRAFGDFSTQRLDDGSTERAAGQISPEIKQELVPLHQRSKKAAERLREVIWNSCIAH